LKNVRITRSVQSCAIGDSVATISGDALIEMSPTTAALNAKFPDYTTTYCFCFKWRHQNGLTRARTDPRDVYNGNATRSAGVARFARDASEAYIHQGSGRHLCVATGQRSWFG
jgi:hypothetical protein